MARLRHSTLDHFRDPDRNRLTPSVLADGSDGPRQREGAGARERMVAAPHDFLPVRMTHRKPKWLADVSTCSACRAAGR
jgi:hypothetical protein